MEETLVTIEVAVAALKEWAAAELKAAKRGLEVELPNAYTPVVAHLGDRVMLTPLQLYHSTYGAIVKRLEANGHVMPVEWLAELANRLKNADWAVCDGPTGWLEEIPYFTDLLARADEVLLQPGVESPASTGWYDLNNWWQRYAYANTEKVFVAATPADIDYDDDFFEGIDDEID